MAIVFLVMKINKKYPIYASKKWCEEKHLDLLFIEEEKMVKAKEAKRHHILIRDFNTFMFDYVLHHERRHFCCHSLQAFISEDILKSHIKDCLKLMVNEGLRCLIEVNTLYSKFLKECQNLWFIKILEAFFAPEVSGNQNPDEYYTKKENKSKKVNTAVMWQKTFLQRTCDD